MRRMLQGRAGMGLAFLLGLLMATAGTATAAKLITGKQIKDGSISSKDLSKAVRAQLAKAGVAGPKGDSGANGAAGPKGDTGPSTGSAGGDLTGTYPNPTLAASETWHVVGGPGEPAFDNGWSSFGLIINSAPISFLKDRLGFVHLRGSGQNGTSQCVFTLPVGYRPAAGEGFSANTQGAGGVITANRVNVSASGLVCFVTGFSNVIAPLSGITFQAGQ